MEEILEQTGKIVKRASFIVLVLGIAAVIGILYLVDPLAGTRIRNFVITAGMDWLIIGAILGLAVLLLIGVATKKISLIAISFFAGLGVIAGGIGYWWTADYRSDKHYVAESVRVVDENLPGEFNTRAPFSVAAQTVSSSLGDTVGSVTNVKYVSEENEYTSMIQRRTLWMGFRNPGYTAVVEQGYDDNGIRTGATNCDFSPEANDFLGGPLMNSMEREVSAIDRTLTVYASDAWGYCDGDTPKVVMPVVTWKNFFTPVIEPRGVVIYDGSTRELEYKPEVAPGELPGPAVGVTYSEAVNDSMGALNAESFWDYRTGITGLTDEVKENSDVNADNPTNFGLRNSELGNTFVTPFTSRVASTNVSYLGVLNTNEVTSDSKGTATLYKLDPERNSSGVLADQIRTRFPDIAWQSGLKIQEFTPKSDNVWVATIGHETAFAYRVTITGDEDRQGVYKFDIAAADGADEVPAADGAETPTDGGEGGSVSVDIDFTQMSDAEVAQVIKDATDELVNR